MHEMAPLCASVILTRSLTRAYYFTVDYISFFSTTHVSSRGIKSPSTAVKSDATSSKCNATASGTYS